MRQMPGNSRIPLFVPARPGARRKGIRGRSEWVGVSWVSETMAQPQRLPSGDSSKDPLVGNIKVSRWIWFSAKLARLVGDGAQNDRLLVLAGHLRVLRLSFERYIKYRQQIHDAQQVHRQRTNSPALILRRKLSAPTITAVCCNVFRYLVKPEIVDNGPEFTLYDWRCRSSEVPLNLEASGTRKRFSRAVRAFRLRAGGGLSSDASASRSCLWARWANAELAPFLDHTSRSI